AASKRRRTGPPTTRPDEMSTRSSSRRRRIEARGDRFVSEKERARDSENGERDRETKETRINCRNWSACAPDPDWMDRRFLLGQQSLTRHLIPIPYIFLLREWR